MKKDNSKLIICALIALVVGVLIGVLVTNLTITGEARRALVSSPSKDQILISADILQQPVDEIDLKNYFGVRDAPWPAGCSDYCGPNPCKNKGSMCYNWCNCAMNK